MANTWGHDDLLSGVLELVIVSTCNRTELYFTSDELEFEPMISFLSVVSNVPVNEFKQALYRLDNKTAVDHIYRVATGLDSLVLGEPQILGQVTRALELSLEQGSCGAVLSTLFRSAIHAGKRARAETAISRNPASVSSLAAALIAKEVKNLAEAQVVVIGAGEMAELAVEALRKRGVLQIAVINRTLKKAQALAHHWQARAFTFRQLDAWIMKADIVIASTSAPHPIISAAQMEEIMRERQQHPLCIVDIAVPRNIDPAAGQISGVRLFDIDTLDEQVKQLQEVRAGEVPLVEVILEEEKAQFTQYQKTLDMLPLISGLRRQAEMIRNQELQRTFQRLPDLTSAERERIDAMTRALVKKLLASPTERLRVEANCPHAQEYATVARTLFDLEDETSLCAFSNEICQADTEAACPEMYSV